MNGQHIIYHMKQNDICDYNPICLMSSCLIFDDIIMNIFSNKAVNQHVKLVHSYFTKTKTNKIYIYLRLLQYFYCNKGTHEIPDSVRPYFNVEEKKRDDICPIY